VAPCYRVLTGGASSQALRLEAECDDLQLDFLDLDGPTGNMIDGMGQARGDGEPLAFGPATVTLEARAGTIVLEMDYTPQCARGAVHSRFMPSTCPS